MKFEPDVPDNSSFLRNKILKQKRDEIKEKYLGFFVFLGQTCIYSLENCPEIPPIESEFDGQSYKILIEWVQSITQDDALDMRNFFKCFFNGLLRRTRFTQIGRSHFNPEKQRNIPHHGIAIWPGFSSAL